MNDKRLQRKLDDLVGYENNISQLFDGADRLEMLHCLIAIDQKLNNLIELIGAYLQESDVPIIR